MAQEKAWERYSEEGWLVGYAEGVLRVRLSRGVGNRLHPAGISAFERLLDALAQDKEVRAVWLSAEGEDFCQGMDLADADLAAWMAEGKAERMRFAKQGQAMIEAWASLPIPTVVSMRGRAMGAGACLVTAADFRVAYAGGVLCFPEVDRGMHLSWGILPRMVREYGLPWARRLAMVGERVRIGSLPARAFYLVDEGTEDEQAERLAVALAQKPPLAMRSIKAVLREVTKEDNLATADDALFFAQTVGSEDFQEALTAFFEKRPGRYQGR